MNGEINQSRSGQSLIEVIIGLAIGVALIGAAVLAIVFMLRSGAANQKYQIATGLNRDLAEKIKTVTRAGWNNLYNIGDKSDGFPYHVDFQGGRFLFVAGATDILVDGATYSNFFYVENVYRNAGQNIVESGGDEDPSTQKVTVYTRWPSGVSEAEVKTFDYLTRWENAVFNQTDWSGGVSGGGPVSEPDNTFADSDNIDFSSEGGAIKIQGL